MSKKFKSLDLYQLIHSPSVQKTLALEEKLKHLSPTLATKFEIMQKFATVHTLSYPLSVKALKNGSGLSSLFKKTSLLDRYISHEYEKALRELLEAYAAEFNLDDATELLLHDYELYPQELILPEKKIYLLKEIPKVERQISAIFNDNSRVFGLSPRELEEVVAELLRKQNWAVKLTKRTRDGGYDIFALQHLDDIPINMLVECKRLTKGKVGVGTIRSFSHVVGNSDTHMGMIVTTSYFSNIARQEGDRTMGSKLLFRDYDDLMAWINNQMY